VRGCDLFEFRGDKIVRKDSYWKIVEGSRADVGRTRREGIEFVSDGWSVRGRAIERRRDDVVREREGDPELAKDAFDAVNNEVAFQP